MAEAAQRVAWLSPPGADMQRATSLNVGDLHA